MKKGLFTANIHFWIPHNLPCAMAATSDNEEFDAMALPARWKERRFGAGAGRRASEAMEAGAEVFIGNSSAPRRYGTGAGSFTGHTWALGWMWPQVEAEGLRLEEVDQYLSKTTKWLACGWYWTRPKCFLPR